MKTKKPKQSTAGLPPLHFSRETHSSHAAEKSYLHAAGGNKQRRFSLELLESSSGKLLYNFCLEAKILFIETINRSRRNVFL